MVRSVAERALVRQGYQVRTAANGEEALEILGQVTADDEDGGFDLLISDVVMPTMDGPTMVAPRPQALSRSADPVHVGLCRGAAAPLDRPRQCLVPRQAFLGSAARRGGARCACPSPSSRRGACEIVLVLQRVRRVGRGMTASRSILIVEDESLIAMMLEDFLDSLGHAVAGTEDSVSGALAQAQAGRLRRCDPRCSSARRTVLGGGGCAC